jgi:hypothetical protein
MLDQNQQSEAKRRQCFMIIIANSGIQPNTSSGSQQLLQLGSNTLAFAMSYNLEKLIFHLPDKTQNLFLTV